MNTFLTNNFEAIIIFTCNILTLLINITISHRRIKRTKQYHSSLEIYRLLVLDNLKIAINCIAEVGNEFAEQAPDLSSEPACNTEIIESLLVKLREAGEKFSSSVILPASAFDELLHLKLKKVWEKYDDGTIKILTNISSQSIDFCKQELFDHNKRLLQYIKQLVKEYEPSY